MSGIEHPKITVVTPSLNQGRYLEACICSVLDQDYPNLEYMIVDGGSTDQSIQIIRRYEKHLAWWVSEKDNGQTAAINKGFDMANGQLVAWLNADDFYLPQALVRAAAACREAPDASFYFGRCLRVDEQGTEKAHYVNVPRLVFDREALIYGLNYIPQPSTFIQRNWLKAVGCLDESLRWGMDSDLWIRLSAVAPPASIEHVLAASREHDQTKTFGGSFARVEELRQIARKFSGVDMTPGVLCYYLDTLYQIVLEHPNVFGEAYRSDLTQFWEKTAALLARWRTDPFGNPLDVRQKPPQSLAQRMMPK